MTADQLVQQNVVYCVSGLMQVVATETDLAEAEWFYKVGEDEEVYEHWIVSDWLAARLTKQGEVVFEFAGLTIWGRTTTGQRISADYIIDQILKGLESAPRV